MSGPGKVDIDNLWKNFRDRKSLQASKVDYDEALVVEHEFNQLMLSRAEREQLVKLSPATAHAMGVTIKKAKLNK